MLYMISYYKMILENIIVVYINTLVFCVLREFFHIQITHKYLFMHFYAFASMHLWLSSPSICVTWKCVTCSSVIFYYNHLLIRLRQTSGKMLSIAWFMIRIETCLSFLSPECACRYEKVNWKMNKNVKRV